MMKKLMVAALSALLVSGFGVSAAQAGLERYEFDTAHTQIFFAVDHLGFSTSRGKFLEFDGEILFDESAPETSKVDVVIKTDSINLDHEKWNAHMRSADFFNVEVFPEMTFKSTAIDVTGDNSGTITGDLTILDVTKPVTLQVVHNKSGKHAFSGKYVSGFSAHTMIKRSDFGMKYGLPLIGDDVKITIEVEGVRVEQGGEGTGNK